MHIVLLTPPFSILKEGKGSLFSFKGYGNHIPLGLAHLAAVLENAGHAVTIIDSAAKQLSLQHATDEALAAQPDVLGISVTTAAQKSSYALAESLRAKFTGPIILGGPHAIAFGKQLFEDCPAIDGVCYSEGEEPMLQLIQALEAGSGLKDIDGMWYRTSESLDGIGGTGTIAMTKKLDTLPCPSYHHFDLDYYKALPKQAQRRPYLPYITSRGCVWRKCTFCFEAGKAGQAYRRMSAERVVDDLRRLVDTYGTREIIFCDDNFIVGDTWLLRFADLLEEHHLDLTWSCYARVDTISKPVLTRLREVGLWNVFFGFESGNQDLLDRIQKGITLEQSRQAARWCHELGITIRGSFMLALPGSTPEKDMKTVEFAKEIEATFCQFHLTFPEYGTALWDLAKQEGRFVDHTEFKGRTTASYIPNGYSGPDEVEAMARKAYRSFYLRPRYFWNHLSRIRTVNDIKEYLFGGLFVVGIMLGSLEKALRKRFKHRGATP